MSAMGGEQTSDGEYLRQRIDIIRRQLSDVEGLVPVGHGRVEIADDNGQESEHRLRLRRELRLLKQLQARAPNTNVLQAAEAWRYSLGVRLYDHRQKYLREQDAYDAWAQLPERVREQLPEPQKPPELVVTDRDGERWTIDDRFLISLDEIITKLKRWRDSEP